jgi:hypothetical protein
MAKKQQVGAAFSDLVGPDKKPDKKKGDKSDYRPVGIALYETQIERIDAIANELDQSRSEVIRFAIDDLIRRFDSGEIQTKEETRTEKIKVLKTE